MGPHRWQEGRIVGIALVVALTLGGIGVAGQTGIEGFKGPESFAPLAHATLPAVVNISTTQRVQRMAQPRGLPEFPPGSPFERFFKDFFDQLPQSQPPSRELTALGSGFIIDPAGYVVTNNHVIAGAKKVQVILQDNTELAAKIVGRDPRTDLALLKVGSDKPLPAVEWGDSDAAQVGDWVMAVGNPFGLGGTVTTGIISARARDINAGPYDDFLQTDASINQGNSGGPLFAMNGEVIGVNTAILSPSGGNIGIGFAVPAAMAKPVIDQLRQTGTVERGWLGVQIQPVTDSIAKAVGLDRPRGALVADVLPNSPAARAGLQPGDVIVSFDGRAVREPDELSRIVANTPVDKPVDIGVLRNGKRETVEAKIARLEEPEQQAAAAERGEPGKPAAEALGLSLAELSPELRATYGIPEDTKGALVVDVAEGSPAADEDIAPGDVITKVGPVPVSKPADVVAGLEQARRAAQESVLVRRERGGAPGFVALPTEPGRG